MTSQTKSGNQYIIPLVCGRISHVSHLRPFLHFFSTSPLFCRQMAIAFIQSISLYCPTMTVCYFWPITGCISTFKCYGPCCNWLPIILPLYDWPPRLTDWLNQSINRSINSLCDTCSRTIQNYANFTDVVFTTLFFYFKRPNWFSRGPYELERRYFLSSKKVIHCLCLVERYS